MKDNFYTFSSERSTILQSHELQKYFRVCLGKVSNEIIICSAFIKLGGIKWFEKHLLNKKIKIFFPSIFTNITLGNKKLINEKNLNFKKVDEINL